MKRTRNERDRTAQRTSVPRASTAHPSRGGSRGYDPHWRAAQLADDAAGLPTVASNRSLRRWRQRIQPHEMTGNHEESVFTDEDRFLLLVFREKSCRCSGLAGGAGID